MYQYTSVAKAVLTRYTHIAGPTEFFDFTASFSVYFQEEATRKPENGSRRGPRANPPFCDMSVTRLFEALVRAPNVSPPGHFGQSSTRVNPLSCEVLQSASPVTNLHQAGNREALQNRLQPQQKQRRAVDLRCDLCGRKTYLTRKCFNERK